MSKCRILPPNHLEILKTITLRYTTRHQSSSSQNIPERPNLQALSKENNLFRSTISKMFPIHSI